jgi:hypothetical protein
MLDGCVYRPLFTVERTSDSRRGTDAAQHTTGRAEKYRGENHVERAGPGAELGIVHVLSHSRHRQYVVTVMIVARVSTALPWQKGHSAGRVPHSAESEPRNVIASSAARVERGEFDGVSEQEGGDRQRQSQVSRRGR